MTPTEHEMTVAVDAAARRFYATFSEAPPFDAARAERRARPPQSRAVHAVYEVTGSSLDHEAIREAADGEPGSFVLARNGEPVTCRDCIEWVRA